MFQIISEISLWAIPLVLFFVPLLAQIRGVKVYETFIDGAEQGFMTAVKTIPYLVAMMVAISIFRASGALEVLANLLAPLLLALDIPADILTHAIMRPLSGGAALGIATDIIRVFGPDSFVGQLVSTMQGSTDTTFFVLTLYFGSVGIKKYRYAIAVGLLADLTTLLASLYIVNLVFR